jgi:hypothetical protein
VSMHGDDAESGNAAKPVERDIATPAAAGFSVKKAVTA